MRDDASGNKKNKEISGTDFVENLPIGAYQVDTKGKFIYCNKEAAIILGYDSKEELMNKNINDLYPDPTLRDKLLEGMKGERKKNKNRIRWKTKKEGEIFVDDYAEFVYDDTGKEIGVRGIFVDSSLLRLFDDLNAGIYRIGKDKKSVKFASNAVARMFGYDSPEDMMNIDIKNHYKDPNDFDIFMEKLEKEKRVENYHIRMITKNQKDITISTNCRLIKEDSEIIGREGTFTDITEQDRLEDILEQPLGVYEVELKGEKRVISYCNTTFAKMFGCDSKEDIVNSINITDLYANEVDIKKFEDKLKESVVKGEPYLRYPELQVERIKRKENMADKFWIEIYCYIRKNVKGEVIGRKGIIRDISDTMQLNTILTTREDIQRFSHGLIAPILSIHSTSEVLLDEIMQEYSESDLKYINLEKEKFSIRYLFKEMQSINEKLLKDMEQVVNACKEESLINYKDIEELVKTSNFLKNEIKDTPRKIILIRKHQQDVHRILSRIRMIARTGKEIRNRSRITDPVQICLNDLGILDRLYILYTARQNMNKCKIAYHLIEGFRQLMKRFGEKMETEVLEFKSENIIKIIDEVIDIYLHDAYVKGLIIHPPTAKSLNIEIARSSIERVLSYIIQNAVKYSFSREGYIRIDLADLGEDVRINVENYGVGILKEEIDEGKIFKYGFRGEYSKDRNRTGSGIGLAESSRIVDAHKGRIKVESKPIGDLQDEISSNTPHKTIVSIFLPKKQEKGDGNGQNSMG